MIRLPIKMRKYCLHDINNKFNADIYYTHTNAR